MTGSFSDRPYPCPMCGKGTTPREELWWGPLGHHCSKECREAAEVKKALMRCRACLGTGQHRYANDAAGTPQFSDSMECGQCAGRKVV